VQKTIFLQDSVHLLFNLLFHDGTLWSCHAKQCLGVLRIWGHEVGGVLYVNVPLKKVFGGQVVGRVDIPFEHVL
jgi:hypothetical protein